ncbi:hypothetical protein OPV22_027523 [Ensete ventricosum]|uniref:Uncharacterized protein n=1 Tax=Ensete ventricosum TaxID=4639 RepID=A0AAV8P491_ENSVE|nr:hypothetical protein OPV22_027523 [Ensete ventricosum]
MVKYHKLANPSRSIFTDMERQCYQHNVGNEPIMVRHQPCLFLSMLKVACLVLNLDLEISDWNLIGSRHLGPIVLSTTRFVFDLIRRSLGPL